MYVETSTKNEDTWYKVLGHYDAKYDSTSRLLWSIQEVVARATDDIQKKREIFSTIGSNLTLKDKKLNIEAIHPYLLIENELKSQKALFDSLEPKKRGYE